MTNLKELEEKKVIGWIRNPDTNNEQELEILNYCNPTLKQQQSENREQLNINDWIKVDVAIDKRTEHEKIFKAIDELELKKGDQIIIWDIINLGRSNDEVLSMMVKITSLGIDLFFIKDNFALSTSQDFKSNLEIISIINSLGRRILDQRNKDRIAFAKANSKPLGKPVGTLQNSIYEPYKEEIIKLLQDKAKYTLALILRIIGQGKGENGKDLGTLNSFHHFIKTRKLREIANDRNSKF